VADETVSVDDPEPPDDRLTLVGLKDAVSPDGDTEAERDTEPANELRLVRLITDVPDEPAWIVRLDGLLEMVKSFPDPTVTVFDVVPVAPVESLTVRVAVKLPGLEYVWVTGLPDAVAPSPKVHENVYGEVPPEADPVNVTAWPETGDDGLKVKLAVGPAWWTLHPVSGWSSHPEKEWSWAEQQLAPSQ
jgi:hypothetical protein